MNKYTNKISLILDNDKLEQTKADNDILSLYPQLKLVKDSVYYALKYEDYYFCFNYAFNDNNIQEVEDGFKKLIYEYEPVEKLQANKGDIISFHKLNKYNNIPDGYNCEHFAIISSIDKENINIKSKWGIMGVFSGSIKDLPNTYGNFYIIWKKKKSPTEKKINVKNETVSFSVLTK